MTTKIDEAEAFIREMLAGGPCAQGEVLGEALSQHISRPTLRQAKVRLGVVSRHRGHQGGDYQAWWWSMPDAASAGDEQQG
jgi:hypothetical protein